MTIARLLTQSVTITRRGPSPTKDAYGNRPLVELGSQTLLGYLEQTEARELIVDRQTRIADWMLVVPAGTEIDALSQVVSDDGTFDVVGPPAPFHNPRLGATHHIEVALQRVEGA